MSVEAVKEFFKSKGMENEVVEIDGSSATVALAAAAIGCSEAEIAKTLAFKVNDGAVLVVAAGDTKVSNPKFKQKFSVKPKMLSPDEVLEFVGHAVGGVCPFAVKDGLKIYLDISLKRFEYVYPACGSSNSFIKLSLAQLEDFSAYNEWVDVCTIKD